MKVRVTQLPISKRTILELVIEATPEQNDLAGLAAVNVSIYRLDIERNRLQFGFCATPNAAGSVATVSQSLPRALSDGLYAVQPIRLLYLQKRKLAVTVPVEDIVNGVFLVSDSALAPPDVVEAAIGERHEQRKSYRCSELPTDASQYGRSSRFAVHVFGVGSLLHGHQDLKGYSIFPLGSSFSYAHVLDVVNEFEQQQTGNTVPFSQRIQEIYERDTPLFVINFRDVRAVDADDAMRYCWNLSENIYMILGVEKGHKPKRFATICHEHGAKGVWQVLHNDGYHGNIVPGFDPTQIADRIDRELPVLVTTPRLKLIYQSYVEALAESNLDFAYLKSWSLLEMTAESRVPGVRDIEFPGGVIIKHGDGKSVTTEKAAGKVYQLLFDAQLTPSHSTSETQKYLFENHTLCTPESGEILYRLSLLSR